MMNAMTPNALTRATVVCALSLTFTATASAQPQRRGSDPADASSIRAFGEVGYQTFAAKQSFEAVLGKTAGVAPGGGAQFVLRNRLFFQLAASRFSDDGQRVFRFGDRTFGLGIPVTVTVTAIEFTGGYRFHAGRQVSPYLGLGLGNHSYKETSGFAEAAEDVDRSKTSYHALAGVEFRISGWLAVGAEAQYTRATGIIGTDGVSKDFGETDLGGPTFRFRLLIGREF